MTEFDASASLERWLSKLETCDSPTKKSATFCLFKGQVANFLREGLITQEVGEALQKKAEQYMAVGQPN